MDGAGGLGAARFAAVVPTLDERESIARLVERLLRGAGDADDRVERVIVADGGSRDGTVEAACAAGADVLACERGRGTQMAAGAARAAEEWLVFLHADCMPEPGALRRLKQRVARGNVDACAFEQRIDAAGRSYRWIESAANARVRRGMVYGDSGLAVRRELYAALGGLRPWPLFEDVEFSKRLRRVARVELLDGAVLRISARRWQKHGVLRTCLWNWILRLAFECGVSPERLARRYRPHAEREARA